MDSKVLDYALFHLTPTRTRCDLVVFSGGKSEKLASGLVEPFTAHLEYAKDQILKGGYSVTLRPPTADAFWFTKGTFQRFVRFVSTPEILERFVRTEREILQIERSIQSNEISSTNNAGCESEGYSLSVDGVSKKKANSSNKSKCKDEGAGVASEENSKFHLQRVLGTRKSLLMKEQAMAYARAKAAGYNIEHMEDLIYFAETFGATRLRGACVDFRDLYKQKCKDAQWMDEVAAMEASAPNVLSYMGSSGIILASENNSDSFASNGSGNDVGAYQTTMEDKGLPASEGQLKMPWPNQVPQYMYNFQTPIQQMPPYSAYPFPGGMHPVPPYYPGNGHWPRTADGASNDLAREARRSSKKKEKPSKFKGSEDDEQTEPSSTDSGSDTDESEKHERKQSPHEIPHVRRKKKSSKTVVIRNINYISSKRRNGEMDEVSDGSSSDQTAVVDEDSIKQHLADAVTSLEKHHRSKSHKNRSGGKRGASIQNGANAHAEHGLINDLSTDTTEGGERNGDWNTFQSLLMSQEESHPSTARESRSLDVEDPLAVRSPHDDISSTHAPVIGLEMEKAKVQHFASDASVVVTERHGCDEGRTNAIDISNVEERRSSMIMGASDDLQLVLPQKSEYSGSSPWKIISDSSAESSLIKNRDCEDWYVVNRSENLGIQEAKKEILDESSTLPSEKGRLDMEACKRASVDDSFMVQSRPAFEGEHDSAWRTDIIVESDLIMAPPPETCSPNVSQAKLGVHRSQEPDDLCVVLARDSIIEPSASWTPEMDYEVEISFTEADRRSSVETNSEQKINVDGKSSNSKKSAEGALKYSAKETRSRQLQGPPGRSSANGSAIGKKVSSTSRLFAQRNKLEKEEDIRKRMEELAIQRQKRIAERTAASGASKKVLGKSASSKLDKHRPQSMLQEAKRLSIKPVPASS